MRTVKGVQFLYNRYNYSIFFVKYAKVRTFREQKCALTMGFVWLLVENGNLLAADTSLLATESNLLATYACLLAAKSSLQATNMRLLAALRGSLTMT